MNAYDFDNTIYDGESIFDFFKFCIKKDISLIKFFPKVLIRLIEYKLNKLSMEKLYETAEEIINYFIKNSKYTIEELTKQFWDKNIKKLKPDFLNKLKKEDLIITGCPNFLINHIKDQLKVENIICTEYNFETNEIEFICLGENKVKKFNEKYKDVKINKFYTDSLIDSPFMKCAKEAYMVKGNKITKINI